ncbi:MAG: hypothetical protein R3C61_12545 [Bacteroidia bacterium]
MSQSGVDRRGSMNCAPSSTNRITGQKPAAHRHGYCLRTSRIIPPNGKKLDQGHVIAVSSGGHTSDEDYLIEINALTYSQFRKYEGIDKICEKRQNHGLPLLARRSKEPVYELVPIRPMQWKKRQKEALKIFPLEEQYIRSHVLVLYVEPRTKA